MSHHTQPQIHLSYLLTFSLSCKMLLMFFRIVHERREVVELKVLIDWCKKIALLSQTWKIHKGNSLMAFVGSLDAPWLGPLF